MTEHQHRIAALFDSVADTYDAVGVDLFQPVAAGLVRALEPRPGERALDVGCGRGAVLFPLAEAVTASGSVTGIDLAPRMVEATAADVARAGLSWVDVVVGDATAPAVPPSSFDVVASSLVLFFLPDPLEALRAWREALVDGGRIGVSTFDAYDEQWRDEVEAVCSAAVERCRKPDGRLGYDQHIRYTIGTR